jgi:hypothetical protein
VDGTLLWLSLSSSLTVGKESTMDCSNRNSLASIFNDVRMDNLPLAKCSDGVGD